MKHRFMQPLIYIPMAIALIAAITFGTIHLIAAKAASGSYSFSHTAEPALLGITVSVTPTTPMWKMNARVNLDPTEISCPASLTVTVGQIRSTLQNVCGRQTSAPSQTDILVPVFDNLHPSNTLTPGSSATVTAQLTDSDNQQSSINTTTTIPPAPIWIGLGDSYSSGHYQVGNTKTLACALPINENPSCGVYPNNLAFSWVTRATKMLDNQLRVPPIWLITPDLLATSGATTSDMASKQQASMGTALKSHAGSWNVVSLTGGGNDMKFADQLAVLYATHLGSIPPLFSLTAVPWNVQKKGPSGGGCLNTEAMWQTLNQKVKNPTEKVKTISDLISANLQNIVNTAVKDDPNVRLVDVDYSYIVYMLNVCATDVFKDDIVIWHGSVSTINRLDDLHESLSTTATLKKLKQRR